MNLGDDISNLLRQIGHEATGIYQDLSQYNAARGSRRGLFGRTVPATLPGDLSPLGEPAAAPAAAPAPASELAVEPPATTDVPALSEGETAVASLAADTTEAEAAAPAVEPETARPSLAAPEPTVAEAPDLTPEPEPELDDARFAPLSTFDASALALDPVMPAPPTSVSLSLQSLATPAKDAATLAPATPTVPTTPMSLASLARRLSGETRRTDDLDLSVLGDDTPATQPQRGVAGQSQRLDRLFDRLSSSLSR